LITADGEALGVSNVTVARLKQVGHPAAAPADI